MKTSLLQTFATENAKHLTRRSLFGGAAAGLGGIALGNLLERDAFASSPDRLDVFAKPVGEGIPGLPHFAPKAKRVIYLFQSGGPSHVDLFDHKDFLDQHHGSDLPDSVRGSQRLTGMTSGQSSFPS